MTHVFSSPRVELGVKYTVPTMRVLRTAVTQPIASSIRIPRLVKLKTGILRKRFDKSGAACHNDLWLARPRVLSLSLQFAMRLSTLRCSATGAVRGLLPFALQAHGEKARARSGAAATRTGKADATIAPSGSSEQSGVATRHCTSQNQMSFLHRPGRLVLRTSSRCSVPQRQRITRLRTGSPKSL